MPEFFLKHGRKISFCLVLILGYVGYLWWTTTPYHALREIRRAIKMHDQVAFNKFVDVAHVVSEFTDDLIYEPATRTEGLSRFQKVVGLGALGMSKIPIDNTLIFQIQKWIQKRPVPRRKASTEDGPEEVIEEIEENEVEEPPILKPENEATLKTVLKTEIKFEINKLKNKVNERMVEYAEKSPDTLVNRIFIAPQGKKRNAFRKILRHYGFRKDNISRVEIINQGEKCLCIVHFFCPITEIDVPVHFELEKDYHGQLPVYRVKRIKKIKETFALLGEDTDKQVQGLVRHGLEGLSFQSALSETRNFFQRVKDRAGKFK